MVSVLFRRKAIDDLNKIWIFTSEKWSENQADKYYAMIKYACTEIGENPEIGRTYDGVSQKLLGLKSGKHIIFYRLLSKDKIEVVRILHERMDLRTRILE